VTLADLGWDSGFETEFEPQRKEGLVPARIAGRPPGQASRLGGAKAPAARGARPEEGPVVMYPPSVHEAIARERLADMLRAAARRSGREEDEPMKWVTRERPKTDRIACPWLIRKFIDPEAEFLFTAPGEVLAVAEAEGALSYDAPGARYTHRDGLCSFEVLVEEYGIDDPAVRLLARIVHGADVAEDRDAMPESRGLLAVAEGFHLLGLDDHRQLELSLPVYDALYAWCRREVEAGRA